MREFVCDEDNMQSESLADVKIFLKEVLVQEKLSCTAEKERLRLLQYLDSRESSPPPYLDMSPNSKNAKPDRDKSRTNECYEELSSARSSNTIDSDKARDSNRSSSARSSSSLYYNLTQAFKSASTWDINDDRPSLPQKELRNSSSNSSATSTRNSVCSLTVPTIAQVPKRQDTDSPDAVSEASSTSNNCSSKNCNSSPEVLTVSASALRYSASKCGILNRKEKFLFLDHYKQYWAGLLGHTLYVYGSDKDSKPVLEIDLEGYQARPVGLKESPKKDCSFEIFCPGSKTYQFTAPCAFEMDQWISAICQAGKVPATTDTTIAATTTKTEQPTHRQLPSLPAELMYDQPDSIIRPVTPRIPENYEIMNSNTDDDVFYHYIANDKCPVNEGVLYKNLEEMARTVKGTNEPKRAYNENLYYNLMPVDAEQECIYDTIKEANNCEKTLPTSGRIQQIIKQIEAAAASNQSKRTSLIQDQLYEPVNTPEEKCLGRTVSR